jgi:hypothetical protein
MKEILLRQNSEAISRQVCPVSLLDVSAGICQRALADGSGIISNQMKTHSISEMVALQGSPCAPNP